MEIPWAVIISFAVVAFAFLIKHLVGEIVEEENTFLGIIVVFMFVYATAALAINYFNPSISIDNSVVSSDVISSL
ncbi:MAG: hypothetical protein ABIB04_03055 [Patescibacteria group bacterium]